MQQIAAGQSIHIETVKLYKYDAHATFIRQILFLNSTLFFPWIEGGAVVCLLENVKFRLLIKYFLTPSMTSQAFKYSLQVFNSKTPLFMTYVILCAGIPTLREKNRTMQIKVLFDASIIQLLDLRHKTLLIYLSECVFLLSGTHFLEKNAFFSSKFSGKC